MITENKLKHSIGVARKAYQIAHDLKFNEYQARRMFTLGWNHDIGYEFDPDNHAEVADAILCDFDVNRVILNHGEIPNEKTWEWRIVTMADMTTSPTGEEVSIDERLAEIKKRYGENHKWYISSAKLCEELKKEFQGLLDDYGHLL